MSADGRLVVFASEAGNLVAHDTNGEWDIFVRDRSKKSTIRISDVRPSFAALYPRISADGRFVSYEIYNTSTYTSEAYAYDLTTGSTVLVSATPDGRPAGGLSTETAISGDGRLVAFRSDASNLVARDLNAREDIFVRDLITRRTRLVSRQDDGRQFDADSNYPSISADGTAVAFVAETSFAAGDVYVRDLAAGRTELVSVNRLGMPGGGYSQPTGLSDHGRYVLFASLAPYMTKGDPLRSLVTGQDHFHCYVRDRFLEQTERVSVNNNGKPANRPCFIGAISASGAVVAFYTAATNLDPTDGDGDLDVYLRLRS
jgi:Tol biopolymer transport system component